MVTDFVAMKTILIEVKYCELNIYIDKMRGPFEIWNEVYELFEYQFTSNHSSWSCWERDGCLSSLKSRSLKPKISERYQEFETLINKVGELLLTNVSTS